MQLIIFSFLFCILYNCKAVNTQYVEIVAGDLQILTRDKKLPRKVQNVIYSRSVSKDICQTPGCRKAASEILENIDFDVKPCDDFYKFACGKFLKTAVIPNDKTQVTVYGVIVDELQGQLRTIMEEKSRPHELNAFTMAKDLYKSCMDETAIEENGLETIFNNLKTLGGWPILEGDLWKEEDFDWKQSVYKCSKLGYPENYLFEFSVLNDLKNNTKKAIEISQPFFGLEREYLVKGSTDKIVTEYYNFMVDIAVIFGAERSRADKELKQSLEFEMKLAEISLPNEKRRNVTALYNPMTVKELTGNYTSIPWMEYFNMILKPHAEINEDQLVIMGEPTYFKNFEKLIQLTPKRTQANYIIWRVVHDTLDCLTHKIRKRKLEYLSKYTGQAEREDRWKECITVTSSKMAISVGALYVRKYFNKESKKSTIEMVKNIQKAFKKILQKINWMESKTKKSALEKAEWMKAYIAYPDELLDDKKVAEFYENVEITLGDYLQTILNLTLFEKAYSFSQLTKPSENKDWVSYGEFTTSVNAFYHPTDNSIILPAGILQGNFFSNDRPRYMNYGAIGYVIGHEITHGFDDEDSYYDKDGKLADWWEPKTKEKYFKKAECIIHQYGNYSHEDVGLKLNGINTQGENIADNGGIKAAYLAYQEWVKRNGPEPRLPGLHCTPSQLFWISAAQAWCDKFRPEILKTFITTGFHSPGKFRVWGPFSNRPEFAKDFKCPLGRRMNPKKKCSVW